MKTLSFITLITLLFSCSNKEFNLINIKKGSVTYVYQAEAGGFSSIFDSDSSDWISFKYVEEAPYPKGAESVYRGLPNLVYKGKNDGVGHPGFRRCESVLLNDSTIHTVSLDSLWKYNVTFYSDFVLFDIISTDPEQPYWFLYEGTPGGKWNPDKYYWASDKKEITTELPDFFKNDFYLDTISWACFGVEDENKVFFVAQNQPDDLFDVLGYLGNSKESLESEDGMVVFGFGRDDKSKAFMTQPNSFIFGILEIPDTVSNNYNYINSRIDQFQKLVVN